MKMPPFGAVWLLLVLGILLGSLGLNAQQEDALSEQLDQIANAALEQEATVDLVEARIDVVKTNNFLIALSEMLSEILRYTLLGIMLIFIPRIIKLLLLHSSASSAAEVLTVAGIVLVVFAILAVVILVHDEKQLTTSIGVLGTIAGYLLGTAGRHSRNRRRRQLKT